MDWEYRNPRKITEYATMCGMSASRFAVVFKNSTGNTPSEFIESAKLRRAKELLEKTNMQISEISESVGYHDPLYFSRVFKKNTGFSPMKYRKYK